MPGVLQEVRTPARLRPIRVLIVDDSIVARAVLGHVISADEDFEVVGQAADADGALRALATLSVDIVTLDVEMPGTDGLTALPDIIRLGRGARVLLVSSIAEDGAAAAVKALSLGAADTLPKPGTGRPHGGFAQALISKMRAIGHARGGAYAAPTDPRADGMRLRRAPSGAIRCVAIGASTGGLHALGRMFEALPDPIGVPILVTQHLPAVFMPFFARQLAQVTGREVAVAADGAELVPDRVLVAPGDGHLRLGGAAGAERVRIDRSGPVGGCLPAVDPMFASVAERFGPAGCGVVLTGMGRDGLAGSARLAEAGAAVFVQDPASAVVWGMPGSVAEAGHACAVLEPAAIARRVAIAACRPDVHRPDANRPDAGASSWR